MAENQVAGAEQSYGDRFFTEINTRIRDIEEKQRLQKDRMLLISESFVKERDKTFRDIQDMKKSVILLTEENKRMREVLHRVSELIITFAKKDDLVILQKQFNLFREH